jgi:hypothetical protein
MYSKNSKENFVDFFFWIDKILTNKPVREAVISSGGKKKYKGKSVAVRIPTRIKTPQNHPKRKQTNTPIKILS